MLTFSGHQPRARLVQLGVRLELRWAPSLRSWSSEKLAHLLAASYIKLLPQGAEGIRDIYTGRAWVTPPAGSGFASEMSQWARTSWFQLKT